MTSAVKSERMVLKKIDKMIKCPSANQNQLFYMKV